jgi:hypothetical protein
LEAERLEEFRRIDEAKENERKLANQQAFEAQTLLEESQKDTFESHNEGNEALQE